MIEFVVYGVPETQGSMRAMPIGKRAVVVQGGSKDGRRRLADWRNAIAAEARAWVAAHPGFVPLDEPLILGAEFYLPRPASAPKRVTEPSKKPDLDKLLRAAGDAVTGILYVDDSRIVRIVADKKFAIGEPPCLRLRIRRLKF